MFSNLRLFKAPRFPPDVRQPVSLFQRKITGAGCQEGGLGPPPPAAGEIVNLIFQHLQCRMRKLQRRQQWKPKASLPSRLRLEKQREGTCMSPAGSINFLAPIPVLPKDPSTNSSMSPSLSVELKKTKSTSPLPTSVSNCSSQALNIKIPSFTLL